MRVLLAIDDSAASREATNEVCRRLWPADTTVRVLHIIGKFVPPSQELWYDAGGSLDRARQEIRNRFEALVENAANQIAEHNLTTQADVLDGKPGSTIVQVAEHWQADLIVIGSRGLAPFKRVLTGSVSHYVVDHAKCPVEVIHVRS